MISYIFLLCLYISLWKTTKILTPSHCSQNILFVDAISTETIVNFLSLKDQIFDNYLSCFW